MDKTKVMIFSKKKKTLKADVKYANSPTEQVYQYLGVNISYTGNLKQASIDLSGKATKALFGLNARIKEYSTPQPLYNTIGGVHSINHVS